MFRNQFSLTLIFACLLFTISVQQLTVPLQYSKNQQHSESASPTRHHLLRHQNPNRCKKHSHLSHNIKYIQHYFSNKSQHQSHHLHSLNRQPETDHLRLETFNLEPNIYSFSLPMKIAGINYKMSIDSGSSDIFIKGEKSAGKPKVRYHCGQVCINTHNNYIIGYLDGHLMTYQTTLQVEIGDHKFNQSILVAYKVDHNFKENQGLVGLSFPQLASNPNPSFLQTLKNQQIIDVYAFGVNLNFQQKSKSFITFGSYDKQFFEGDLDFIHLTSSLFYYVRSQGVSIGNSKLLSIKTALFDTGNTCISIPKKYQNGILQQFNKGEGDKKNECFFSVQVHADMFSVLRCKVESFELLPVLNIHLDGKKYAIQKEYYLQACDHRPRQSRENEQLSDNGVWYCDTYIESVSGMRQLFLGDGFFNRYYTYFNLEQKKIGIAKNKEVITVQRIIKNRVDADPEDWLDILTKLNPDEPQQDIIQQIQQNFERDQNSQELDE